MKIETKFKSKDKVFFIHENKVKQDVVVRVNTCSDEIETNIYYEMNTLDRGGFYIKVDESDVFATKEELIASL